jgi:hypothetical protein
MASSPPTEPDTYGPDQALTAAALADRSRYWFKSGEQTGAEALADPTSSPSRRTRQFAYRLDAAKRRSQSQLRRLSPDERRRVERMSCALGDAYLARRSNRSTGRAPRLATNTRPRGSRRGGSGSPTSSTDPGDGDPEPPGVDHPQTRRQTAGAAR